MEGRQKDGLAIMFWFVVTVLSVQPYVGSAEQAVEVAAFLWGIAWLATRMIRNAYTRLGSKAGMPMLQLIIGFAVYVWLAPFPVSKNLLTVWGIGLPVVLLGISARTAHGWLTDRRPKLWMLLRKFSVVLFLTVPLVSWWADEGLLSGVWQAFLLSLALLPFYYGWQLGERPGPDDRDARFADPDHFRRSGASRDL
jgi:hypothetical protein